jgi:hypothetical protein
MFGFLGLGSFVFLRLLCGARVVAVAEAERLRAIAERNKEAQAAATPEVS